MNRTQKQSTATNAAPRESIQRKATRREAASPQSPPPEALPREPVREKAVREKTPVSPLRLRMIRDMELAGLVPGTQRVYIGAVAAIQDLYGVRPDRLSEKQVRL